MGENIKSENNNLTLKDVVMLLEYKGYYSKDFNIDNNTITFTRNNLPPVVTFPNGIKKIDNDTIEITYKTYTKVYEWVESLPLAIEFDKWRTNYNTYRFTDNITLDFDAHIADVIIELNKKGYITYTSCGGHYTGNDYSPIYIGFISYQDVPVLPYNISNCKVQYFKDKHEIKIFLNTVTIEERDRVLKELLQWAKNLLNNKNVDHLTYWQDCYDKDLDWGNYTLIKSRPISDLDNNERWQR